MRSEELLPLSKQLPVLFGRAKVTTFLTLPKVFLNLFSP
jgi:hypothetical protein